MSEEASESLGPSPQTYPKRDLPEFSSTYPHGLISGQPRNATAQKAFEARKITILRSMTEKQIEEAYQETVKKIRARLEEDKKKNDDINRELDVMEQQRELERRLYRRQKEEAESRRKKAGAEVKEERVEQDTMDITQT